MRIINTMLRNLAYYALLAVWYLLSLLPLRVLYVLSDFFYLLLAYVVAEGAIELPDNGTVFIARFLRKGRRNVA